MSTLEAVYYPHAIPQSRAALTVLALVYDRIHLPGVYLPEQGFSASDLTSTRKWMAEQERQHPIARINPGWRYLNQYLQLLPEREHLEEFCVFPDAAASGAGSAGLRLSLEVSEFHPAFSLALERETGVRIPRIPGTVAQELPNGGTIEMAGWGTYSANALLYGLNHGLHLVNDDPSLPFLMTSLPEESRAKSIATTLALQSVGMMLPRIRSLTLEEIVAFRKDAREVIRPFRDSMLTMAVDVEALLRDRGNPDEIERAARYIAETKVMPQLNELRRFVDQPTKPWSRRVADMAKEVPTLAAAVMVLPAPAAVGLIAARVVAEVVDVGSEIMEKDRHVNSHGAGYLLRISEDLR
jgi:hypothetical protein